MNDIDKYKQQVKRAEDVNHKIASLEGSRNEVIRQLAELGYTPENLDEKIKALEQEILEAEELIRKETAELEQAVNAAESIING